MQIEIREVYTFKLTSGEELVARVQTDIEDGWITIENPVSVTPGPQGMALMPSTFTGDPGSDPQLNISNVTFFARTDNNVKTKYIEATTGLRVPERKLVLG
jgi:hypothetical protein